MAHLFDAATVVPDVMARVLGRSMTRGWGRAVETTDKGRRFRSYEIVAGQASTQAIRGMLIELHMHRLLGSLTVIEAEQKRDTKIIELDTVRNRKMNEKTIEKVGATRWCLVTLLSDSMARDVLEQKCFTEKVPARPRV